MYLLDFGTCISYLYTVAMMISKTYIFTVFGIQRTSLLFPLQWRRKIIKLKKLEAKWYIAIKPLMGYIKGFRPSGLIFHEWNKIVSYSFSSSVIEYNSNEKLLEAWSGARFYKNQHYVLSWYEENLTQYKQIAYFFVTH